MTGIESDALPEPYGFSRITIRVALVNGVTVEDRLLEEHKAAGTVPEYIQSLGFDVNDERVYGYEVTGEDGSEIIKAGVPVPATE